MHVRVSQQQRRLHCERKQDGQHRALQTPESAHVVSVEGRR
jgi:hypothetical protein